MPFSRSFVGAASLYMLFAVIGMGAGLLLGR